MRLIVCGDSFNVEDSRYPDIHWTDHLRQIRSDIDIINFAQKGASNGLIALQVLQAILLDPDFVMISFSSIERYEADNPDGDRAIPEANNIDDLMRSLRNYFLSTKTLGTGYNKTLFDIYERWIVQVQSSTMNNIRNRLIITACLQALKSRGIGFCYSQGNLDLCPRRIGVDADGNEVFLTLESLQAHDPLSEFDAYKLSSNVWDYREPHGPANFHIMDADWQEQHCKNIIDHINSWHANGQTQHTK